MGFICSNFAQHDEFAISAKITTRAPAVPTCDLYKRQAKRQAERNSRGETSDISTESEEYEGSSSNDAGTQCIEGSSRAPAQPRVLEQVYTQEFRSIVNRRGKLR